MSLAAFNPRTNYRGRGRGIHPPPRFLLDFFQELLHSAYRLSLTRILTKFVKNWLLW